MTAKETSSLRSHEPLRRLTLSAMFIAVGLILPFFTGQIQQIGSMLLPMHLPVLLCGLVCGWQYGGLVGLILPPLRSLLFGMPLLYPNALSMAVELAVYGACIGLVYGLFKKQNPLTVYIALIPAMILGRVAWGATQTLLLGLTDTPFGAEAFLFSALFNAIPGIILQLVLIPTVMTMLHVVGAVRFRGKGDRS